MLKRRFVLCTAASLAFASAVGVSLGGCADTEGTFYVLNAIPGKIEEGFCIFDPGATPLLDGSYEVLGGDEYGIGLIARNSLVTTADPAKPRVEANHVEIYAVDVSLKGKGIVSTSDCPSDFTYPAKGFVEPESDGATRTLVIPSCTRVQLNAAMALGETQTVIATFVVHGHTTGGDEVETPEFDFPISVSRFGFCAAVKEGEDDSTACGVGVNVPAPIDICKANSGP